MRPLISCATTLRYVGQDAILRAVANRAAEAFTTLDQL